MGRIALRVSSFDEIPVNRCLTAIFKLPDGNTISTPFVHVKHSDRDFIFNIDFIVIDEKERSNIIQYMYNYQIEQKKKLEKKKQQD